MDFFRQARKVKAAATAVVTGAAVIITGGLFLAQGASAQEATVGAIDAGTTCVDGANVMPEIVGGAINGDLSGAADEIAEDAGGVVDLFKNLASGVVDLFSS